MSDAGCCEHWEEVAGPEMEARIAELERREALYATVATQARRYLTATQRGDNIADMSRRDLVTALNAVEGDQVTTGFVVAEIEVAQDAA